MILSIHLNPPWCDLLKRICGAELDMWFVQLYIYFLFSVNRNFLINHPKLLLTCTSFYVMTIRLKRLFFWMNLSSNLKDKDTLLQPYCKKYHQTLIPHLSVISDWIIILQYRSWQFFISLNSNSSVRSFSPHILKPQGYHHNDHLYSYSNSIWIWSGSDLVWSRSAMVRPHNHFYRTQVSLGSDLWVRMSLTQWLQDYVQT